MHARIIRRAEHVRVTPLPGAVARVDQLLELAAQHERAVREIADRTPAAHVCKNGLLRLACSSLGKTDELMVCKVFLYKNLADNDV